MSKVLRSRSVGPGLRAWLLLLSVLGALGSGCGGDRQVVLVSLVYPGPRPMNLSGLGVYYSVDSVTGRTAVGGLKATPESAPNYDLFGISLDKGVSGTLVVDVYGHLDSLPCIRFRGHTDVALSGEPKQQVEVRLDAIETAACDTSFPKGTLPTNPRIWARELSDMWIVGDQGRILRWNGAYFETIPLPPSIADAPALPATVNLRSVRGTDSRNVWIVGEAGAVFRWDGTKLERINPLYLGNQPFLESVVTKLEITDVWVEPGLPDVVFAAWTPNDQLYFGYGRQGNSVVSFVNALGDTNLSGDVRLSPPPRPVAVSCSLELSHCFWVGDRGLLIAWRGKDTKRGYINHTMKTDSWTPKNPSFTAVNVFPDPSNREQYELFGVGNDGALFQGPRQVFDFGGMTTVVESNPTQPSWVLPKIQFTTVTQRDLAQTPGGGVLVGGAGGFVGKMSSAIMGNVQTIPVGAQDEIANMMVVQRKLLILTKSGQIFDAAIP